MLKFLLLKSLRKMSAYQLETAIAAACFSAGMNMAFLAALSHGVV